MRKSPMRITRWTLLILYLVLVAELLAYCLWERYSVQMFGMGIVMITLLVISLGSIGFRNLDLPVSRWRRILLFAITGLLADILVALLALALFERFEPSLWHPTYIHRTIFCLGWILLGLILHRATHGLDRFTVLLRITAVLFFSSAAVVLVALPLNSTPFRKPGWIDQPGSSAALFVGICVLVWSIGLGIFLLFAYPRYQREKKLPRCRNCGYDLHGADHERCPECGNDIPEKSPQRASEAP